MCDVHKTLTEIEKLTEIYKDASLNKYVQVKSHINGQIDLQKLLSKKQNLRNPVKSYINAQNAWSYEDFAVDSTCGE